MTRTRTRTHLHSSVIQVRPRRAAGHPHPSAAMATAPPTQRRHGRLDDAHLGMEQSLPSLFLFLLLSFSPSPISHLPSPPSLNSCWPARSLARTATSIPHSHPSNRAHQEPPLGLCTRPARPRHTRDPDPRTLRPRLPGHLPATWQWQCIREPWRRVCRRCEQGRRRPAAHLPQTPQPPQERDRGRTAAGAHAPANHRHALLDSSR